MFVELVVRLDYGIEHAVVEWKLLRKCNEYVERREVKREAEKNRREAEKSRKEAGVNMAKSVGDAESMAKEVLTDELRVMDREA